MPAAVEEPTLTAPPAPLLPIRVRAKFFFDGDEKFFLKGVTYGPFAPDAEGNFVGNPGAGAARPCDDARDSASISSGSITSRPSGSSISAASSASAP